MPQQLSLFTSIPTDDLKITLHTLSLLTGMPPSPLLEHSLIWEPRHTYRPVLAAGQVNQIEQYRIRATCDLTLLSVDVPDALKSAPSDYMLAKEKEILMKAVILSYIDPNPETQDLLSKREWNLHIAELPEAGKRSVISQSILSAQPQVGNNPFEFLDKLGYMYKHEYWIKGYMYVYNNIVINIFRLCAYQGNNLNTKNTNIQDEQQQSQPTANFLSQKDILNMELPSLEALENLRLLDGTGRWTVQTFINVDSVTDIDAINSATLELEKLKNETSGLFDLEMPDRTAFDSRIKRR